MKTLMKLGAEELLNLCEKCIGILKVESNWLPQKWFSSPGGITSSFSDKPSIIYYGAGSIS